MVLGGIRDVGPRNEPGEPGEGECRGQRDDGLRECPSSEQTEAHPVGRRRRDESLHDLERRVDQDLDRRQARSEATDDDGLDLVARRSRLQADRRDDGDGKDSARESGGDQQPPIPVAGRGQVVRAMDVVRELQGVGERVSDDDPRDGQPKQP